MIIASLAGEASAEEADRLAEWRAADPANEREFQRISRAWEAADGAVSSMPETTIPTASEIMESADARRPAGPTVAIAGGSRARVGSWDRRRSGVLRGLAIAASLVIGVALGLVMVERRAGGAYGPGTLVTGVGEYATTTLEDGTIVRVAPQTRIEFSPGRSRRASLEGRAFFAVPTNRDPFRIQMSGGEVEVLGTRFELEGRHETVQVAVLEGQVRLSARGYQAEVGPNQIARTAHDGPPQVEDVQDVFGLIDWLGDFLAFESTPMTDVVVEFERRFSVQIEVADSALLATRVTGWFANQSPEEMIAGICIAIGVDCAVRDGVVRIERGSSRRPPANR